MKGDCYFMLRGKFMTFNKRSKFVVAICITFALVLFIVVLNIDIKKEEILSVRYHSADEGYSVFPIAYLEENIGREDYSTTTVQISKNDIIKLEKHFRTFSKTYPESAVGDIEESRKVNGQLLSFYKTFLGSIYLYDRAYSIDKKDSLRFTNMDKEYILKYGDKEDFFDLLYFGNYYICSFAQLDERYEDYDTLKIDVLSKEFTLTEQIYIDIKKHNLKPRDIINKALVVCGDNVMIPIKKEGSNYLLKYNTISRETTLMEKKYNLIGILYDLKNIYLLGYDSQSLIVETCTDEGETLSRDSIGLKLILKDIHSDVLFDKILYMWDGYIYGCFSDGSKYYYFSYNTRKKAIGEIWEVKNLQDRKFLMDNKYMILYQGKLLDMFPYIDNYSFFIKSDNR